MASLLSVAVGLLLLCIMLQSKPTCAQMQVQNVIISEIGMDGGQAFIELFRTQDPPPELSALHIVLYDGLSEKAYAPPISLTGYTFGETGYFTIGTAELASTSDVTLGFDLTGLHAVALYFGLPDYFQEGSSVITDDLVDAIVYTSDESVSFTDSGIGFVLSPGQDPVKIEFQDGVSSLSRCRGWRRNMPQSFRNVQPSPGTDNVCMLPKFVINEFDYEPLTMDQSEEFVEVSDGGVGFQSLDGVMLVFYNGNKDDVSDAFDLTGYSTNANGLAVIGFANKSFTDIPVAFSENFGLLHTGFRAIGLHLRTCSIFHAKNTCIQLQFD